METTDIVLLAVTLLILGEVSYLLAKLPKTTSIKTKSRVILVDTSVIMDGRITGLAATGFIGGTLVIPRSVIGELQFLADNADADKRARARSGLDVVSELQKMEHVDVEILQDGSKAEEGVDERLLNLAKQHSAIICTLDFNLNKVAVVEGIQVLNINELAQSLRMSHLPGERMLIELNQKGQDSHQGVGYLPDGTMVVVEQSNSFIGQVIEVEVVRSLQTAAGKMMFAKRVGDKKPLGAPARKQHGTGRAPSKPAGKKEHSPQPVTKAPEPAAVPTKATKPAQTVYHAHPPRKQYTPKAGDHQAEAPQQKPQSRQKQQPRQAKTVAPRPDARTSAPAAARPKSSRRPTQKDREAAFMNLIDKQD